MVVLIDVLGMECLDDVLVVVCLDDDDDDDDDDDVTHIYVLVLKCLIKSKLHFLVFTFSTELLANNHHFSPRCIMNFIADVQTLNFTYLP